MFACHGLAAVGLFAWMVLDPKHCEVGLGSIEAALLLQHFEGFISFSSIKLFYNYQKRKFTLENIAHQMAFD